MSKGSKTYYKRKADRLISRIVRFRGGCEKCGRKSGVQLQCAHFISRSNHTLRFDLMNVLLLCAGCHMWGHKDPQGFVEWFKDKYPRRYDYVAMNKHRLTKRTINDYKELVEMLENKLEVMMK